MKDLLRQKPLIDSLRSTTRPVAHVYRWITYTGVTVARGRIDVGFVGGVTATAPYLGNLGNNPQGVWGNLASARDVVMSPENSDIGISSVGLRTMIQNSEAKALHDYVVIADADAVKHLAIDLITVMSLTASGRTSDASRLLNSWVDTAEISLDKDALEDIAEARDEIRRGGGRPWTPRST